jgi:hypothetical protein
MNGRLKIVFIIGAILLICGVAVGGAGYMSGGAKGVLVGANGPEVIDLNDEGQMEKVNKTFTSVSAINLAVDNMDRVVIKEGPDVSVTGQNSIRFGGLKAELDADGTLVVGHSAERRNLNLLLDLSGVYITAHRSSFVEITVPRSASLSVIAIDVDYADVEIGNVAAGRVVVKADSGVLAAEGLTCGSLSVSSDYGDSTIANVDAGDAVFSNQSGDVSITNLTASGRLTIESSYGNVTLGTVSAAALEADLSSGDFTAEGVSVAGGMNLRNSYGNVVLRGDLHGDSAIRADSGNVGLTLDGAEDDYFVTAETESGNLAIGDRDFGGAGYIERGAQSAPNHIEIRNSYGDVRVNWREPRAG